MPISSNLTFCLAHGYPTAPCWYNYTITSNSVFGSYIPDPLHIVTQNIPWFGIALWLVTYVGLFILFHKSGGREKFMAMGIGGFLASIVYAQGALIGAANFAFSFFILICSIVAYSLIKDSGE